MSNLPPPPANRWTRDYVFDILRDLGIHYIFGVPGTNEIPIIDGCSYPENNVTYIECLHENIAIGAAREAGVPLHHFLDKIGADPTARYVGFKCFDDYSTVLDMPNGLARGVRRGGAIAIDGAVRRCLRSAGMPDCAGAADRGRFSRPAAA